MGACAAAEVIALEGVTKRFGSFVAVDDLSFRVMAGEIVALVGKTGAGKSTAMNLIMGNLTPTSGSIRVAGRDPSADFAALRSQLAVGFQTDRLLPWRTALQNVELGLQILRVPRSECARRAAQWLARVKLDGAADKYPHELSGGMRQRVSLARALAIDPAILLLDECFSQLDHVTSKTLRADVSGLIRELGKSCLFITHRIDDAIEMADRILVLGAPAKLLLEVAPTVAERTDPSAAARLHARIADAMGDDDEEAAAFIDPNAPATDLAHVER
jgi:NitT/TauT family transport system ATP-binding protein